MLSPGRDAYLAGEMQAVNYLWVVCQVDLPGDVVYCTYPLLIFLPALCLENYSRFATGRGDLEAVSSVFTIHCHHRAVVQVLNQASSHSTPGLAHEVPALGEEVQPLPRGGDQSRLVSEIEVTSLLDEVPVDLWCVHINVRSVNRFID